jgi:galactokinase
MDYQVTYVPFSLHKVKWLIINSNVPHDLLSSAYNDRRLAVHSAKSKVKQQFDVVDSFRDITISMLDYTDLSAEEYRLSRFVVEEISRVDHMTKAIRENEIPQIVKILNQGHEGLRNLYNVTCRETDYIVDWIRDNGCHLMAGRQMGGGFGGALLCLANEDIEGQEIQDLLNSYKDKFAISANCIELQLSDGVACI